MVAGDPEAETRGDERGGVVPYFDNIQRAPTFTVNAVRKRPSGMTPAEVSAINIDANARLALAVSTIAFGYFLKRVGLVDVDVGKAMLKVLFNATLPAMLLMTFASLTFDATSVAVSLCAMAP